MVWVGRRTNGHQAHHHREQWVGKLEGQDAPFPPCGLKTGAQTTFHPPPPCSALGKGKHCQRKTGLPPQRKVKAPRAHKRSKAGGQNHDRATRTPLCKGRNPSKPAEAAGGRAAVPSSHLRLQAAHSRAQMSQTTRQAGKENSPTRNQHQEKVWTEPPLRTGAKWGGEQGKAATQDHSKKQKEERNTVCKKQMKNRF